MMDSIVAGVKRECWEHKNIVVGLPLVISALSIVALVGAMLAATYYGDESRASVNHGEEIFSFEFIGFFISASWLACIYYLLSCLHSDRKDKSILFWKSLPVSETQNVLTKLLVGCAGFVALATIIAWLTSFILLALFASASILGVEQISQQSSAEFNAVKFLLWPLISLIMGFIWGAPVFAYVLMVSAIARRSPFLLLVVPLVVLSIVEGMFFKSSHVIGFFSQHLPFGVLKTITESADIGVFLQYYLIENGLNLVVGLSLAVAFTAVAIWFRNNRFEI